MSEYDHLADDVAIPADLMAGEEFPPEPPPQNPQAAVDKEPLPPDIQEVWGVSPESAAMAASLISSWGLEQFRTSAIHRNAIREREREQKMEPIRAAFIKAKKEKG